MERRRVRLVELLSLAAVFAALAIVAFAATSQPDRATYAVAAAPAPVETTGFAEPAPAPAEAQPQAAPQIPSSAEKPETEREAPPSSATGEHPVVQVKPGRAVVLRDAPGGDPVATVGDETDFGSPSVFSVVRSTDTWVAAPSPAMPDGEPAWIKADPRKLFGGYVDYAVHVDLSQRRAELLRHGVVVRRWPVTVGGPDSPTPTGTFAVTDLFRGDLNPAYGCCAVALTATQPNLPADWPGGNRIAIHGTDEPLGEAASHGCIRSADADVSRLVDTLPLGTPVRIDP